jgi:DNA-binding IclR family transcriptional regulator
LKKEISDSYFAAVHARMAKGAVEYGEKSWSRDPIELITEIMEELADQSGWAGIAWTRLEGLRGVLLEVRAKQRTDTDR